MEHYQTTVEYSLTTFSCSVTALFHHNRIFFTHRYIKTALHYAILIDRSTEKRGIKYTICAGRREQLSSPIWIMGGRKQFCEKYLKRTQDCGFNVWILPRTRIELLEKWQVPASGAVVQCEKRTEWSGTSYFNNAINLAWKTGNPTMNKASLWLILIAKSFFFIVTVLSSSMTSLSGRSLKGGGCMGLIFSWSSSIRFSVGQRSPDLPLHLMSVNPFQLTGDLGIQPSKDL